MASGVGESVGTASRLTGIHNLCSNRKSLSCATAAATAKSLQLCPTLCDPVDDSPPGSAVPRIVQARTLEWVAIPSSGGSSQPSDRTWVSCSAGRFFTPNLGVCKSCFTYRCPRDTRSLYTQIPNLSSRAPHLANPETPGAALTPF